jgi:dynein intermediate chain
VVYSKEIQTSEGSFDVPQLSEDEIRQQIMDELAIKEEERLAELEEERLRNELEKTEEYQGEKAP